MRINMRLPYDLIIECKLQPIWLHTHTHGSAGILSKKKIPYNLLEKNETKKIIQLQVEKLKKKNSYQRKKTMKKSWIN